MVASENFPQARNYGRKPMVAPVFHVFHTVSAHGLAREIVSNSC
jgi:hypothetical protein